jgi:hypothetical protein
MKFEQYLKNNKDPQDQLLRNINKNCQYYLSLLKKNSILPFERGMDIFSKGIQRYYGKRAVRQNRRPHGMGYLKAKDLNEILEKYHHVRRDKAVFATSDSYHGEKFGKLYYIFPIGDFSYTWYNSTESDINFDYKTLKLLDDYRNIKDTTQKDRLEEEINKRFITNNKIKTAYTSKHEIWFDCKEYYYCYMDLFKGIEMLKGSFNI